MSLPYSKLPAALCRKVGINAGVLLAAFDPETGAAARDDIIGATTGPVAFSATPRLVDYGAGVNNCPRNARELMGVADWEVRLSGTLICADTPATRRLMALADSDAEAVRPRMAPDQEADFPDLWYVFDYGGSGLTGDPGRYAIRMKNALSTGGFRVQTEDREKARWPFEFTACFSLEDDAPPFEIYVHPGGEAEA